MSWLADLPVQRKLRFAMLFTSSMALVLACGVFLGVEYNGYLRNIEQTMAALARVTANNSTAAIAFADPDDAQENLEALRAEPQVLAAALYDSSGVLIASYRAEEGVALPEVAPDWIGPREIEDGVVHVEPVVQESRRLGTIYLQGTLEQLYARMRIYAAVVVLVLAASIALAWMLASVLQRTLARPVIELASTADAISKGSDYSLRARQYGRDELGRLTAAFNAMLERTQQAVGALRESEARFRQMADAAPVLIWLADTSGGCTWVNQRWVDFVGKPLERLTGDGWIDSIHPDDRPHALEAYHVAFRARKPFYSEYRMRRHDGEDRWVIDHGIPRFGAGGDFTGYIGSCTDVTDRKLGEQEVALARDKALAASRAKDEFLAALSHELRTPLNPVLLVASDAAQNPDLPESVRADFDLIAKNVALEARLIDDLLDLTRIVRGKLSLDLRPRDLHVILQDAIATVWSDLESKGIRLHLDLAAEQGVIWGDAVRLQQVFWNVLKNAVKFTPERGEVSVETRTLPESGRVRVLITDTGIGLTPAELGRIFEAFSQGEHAEGTKTHRFGGLGLGLAISRMIVELHSGTIHATSEGRDKGATFHVELPLALDHQLPETGRAGNPFTGFGEPVIEAPVRAERHAIEPRRSVLVVEDHQPTARTLTQLLTRRGFDVVAAGTVAEARAAAAARQFELVISDIGLPDGDGVELMTELRASHPALRGLALSGYGAEQDISRSHDAGFEDHLTKPINVEALDRAVAKLLVK